MHGQLYGLDNNDARDQISHTLTFFISGFEVFAVTAPRGLKSHKNEVNYFQRQKDTYSERNQNVFRWILCQKLNLQQSTFCRNSNVP